MERASPPSPVAIRAADEGDRDAIVAMWLALGRAGRDADHRYVLMPGLDRAVDALVGGEWLDPGGPSRAWVAQDEHGRIAGYVAARPVEPHWAVQQPPTILVTDLFVEPAYRRSGVGRSLVDAVRAHALAVGVAVVEVGTLALDEQAVGFWRSVGFGDWRLTLRHDL